MPKRSEHQVLQLRIALERVEPAVWRRLLVPGAVRLDTLHSIFQVTMGWTDSHLHDFTIGDRSYGTLFDDPPEDEIDETAVTVADAVGEHDRFRYEYDFGDSWDHEVVVEDVVQTPQVLKHAVCLDGERACPPENCGGASSYAKLLEVLTDPEHEQHDFLMEQVGEGFDPTAFDVVSVNVALQHLR